MQCVGTNLSGAPLQCEYEAIVEAFTGCCQVLIPLCPAHTHMAQGSRMTAIMTEESLPCLVLTQTHKPHGYLPHFLTFLGVN